MLRSYETVFIATPVLSDVQMKEAVAKYLDLIKENGGEVVYEQDWGLRKLAYPIQKLHKAHYVLMNVEAEQEAIDSIENNFRFNDAVIRNLVIRTNGPVTEQSPMMKAREERRAREDDGEQRQRAAKAEAEVVEAAEETVAE